MNSTPTQAAQRSKFEQTLQKKLFARVWVALKRKWSSLSFEDMEDVWSHTCMKIFELTQKEGLPPFPTSDDLFRFVFRLAHNRAVDLFRKNKEELDLKSDFRDLEIIADMRRVVQPSDVYIAQENLKIISHEIARLPDLDRLVLEVSIDIEADPAGHRRSLYKEVTDALAARDEQILSQKQVYALRSKVRAVLKERLRLRGVNAP